MQGDGLLIRSFEPADQDAARGLVLAGLAEHFGTLDAARNPDLREIQASYLAAGHVFLVAVAAGEIVGTGGLRVESAAVGRIVRMSVAQTHRRRGIGHRLVTRLIELARERGLREVRVGTEPDWRPAIALYTGCGFVEYGRDGEDIHYRLPL